MKDFINKPLDDMMNTFLENCTINFEFSKVLLSHIVTCLIDRCSEDIRNLIISEDQDIQKLGSQLLFGEYLYIFNTALRLRHYDYECLHYPHLVLKFIYRNNYTLSKR